MVTGFYFIVFVLALMLTGSFLIRNKSIDTVFVLFSIFVTINCFGRYMLSTSESLQMAIWANKILYVGGCYAPLLSVLVLTRLCNMKIPKILLAAMTIYSTLVMCLVMTIGKYGIYYKNVEMGYGDGYNYLMKTYGPLHILYPIMMIFYATIMIFYMIYALKKRNQISFRAVITISVAGFSIFFLYILESIIGLTISFMSIGYLIGIALLIKYFERINMYDMSANIVNSIENTNEYGYMVFDDKYRYVNANNLAKEIFPEIESWIVDKEVPVSDSCVYKEVIKYLNSWDNSKKANKTIKINNSYFQLDIRQISYGKKSNVGYLLELVDRTLEKNTIIPLKNIMLALKKRWQKKQNIFYT